VKCTETLRLYVESSISGNARYGMENNKKHLASDYFSFSVVEQPLEIGK
jgi:hypothetical protein